MSRRPLMFEPLEARRLLAVATVDTELDVFDFNDGMTSLREAIFAANTLPGADTIKFANQFSAAEAQHTMLLTAGEIEISEAVTIEGPGSERLTIDAQQLSRVFNITATTGDVTIEGLALANGRVQGDNTSLADNTFGGGAIRSVTAGKLTLENCLVTDSVVKGTRAKGGGIYAAGELVLRNSNVYSSDVIGLATMFGATHRGGGIFAEGKIQLESSQVIGNEVRNDASATNGSYLGGGIYAGGNVTLRYSAVNENRASGPTASGGGIYAAGDIAVFHSTISANEALASPLSVASGGGIHALGNVALRESSVNRNRVEGESARGGGIWLSLSTLTVDSSTIAGNEARHGGGVSSSGSATIRYSTIAQNTATVAGGGYYGQGVASTTIDIVSSILAANIAAANSGSDLLRGKSAVTMRHSFLGDNSQTPLAEAPLGAPDANGNFVGGPLHGVIDPQLSELTEFLDPYPRSLRPLDGSPVIDAGDPAAAAGYNGVPNFDQGGMGQVRVFDGDGDGIERIDMGAVEKKDFLVVFGPAADFNHNYVVDLADYTVWRDTLGQVVSRFAGADANGNGRVDQPDLEIWKSYFGTVFQFPFPFPPFPPFPPSNAPNLSPIVVTTTLDAANFTDGLTSLREAVFVANTMSGEDTIVFDESLTDDGPATVELVDGTMDISTSLAILGPGADQLTIDASASDPTPNVDNNDGSGIFRIDDGEPLLESKVAIHKLALRGSDGLPAIYSKESITLDEMAFSDNHSLGGGALWIGTQSATITDSLFENNRSSGSGGGIYAFDSLLTILNSTFSGNRAQAAGGGIYTDGYVDLNFSTITNNHANGSGGGLSIGSGFLYHALVAANSAGAQAPDIDAQGGSYSAMLSLIGSNDGSPFEEAPVGEFNEFGNLIGGPIHGLIDPKLGPLLNNGGPTRTHALLPGSPAIDAGYSVEIVDGEVIPLFDQRGPEWSRGVGEYIDIGAFEAQPNPLRGDNNFNGAVDTADYSVWRDTLGSTNDLRADGAGSFASLPDGGVDEYDYAFWKANFGNVLSAGSGALGAVDEPQATLAESTAGLAGVEAAAYSKATSFESARPERLGTGRRAIHTREVPAREMRADMLAASLARRGGEQFEKDVLAAFGTTPTVSEGAEEDEAASDSVFALLGELGQR